jgi:hypothetical protein
MAVDARGDGAPREIPRPAGENAGRRDDAVVGGRERGPWDGDTKAFATARNDTFAPNRRDTAYRRGRD